MRGYEYILPYPLRIVTGRVMSKMDQAAIESRNVPGLFLMEHAGESIAKALLASIPTEELNNLAIFCGPGNNGGDGFVLARHLYQSGRTPHVGVVGQPEKIKGDARTSYEKLLEINLPVFLCPNSEMLMNFIHQVGHAHVWVDALLGTGSRGAPRGLIGQAIEEFNKRTRKKWTVSVDIPSGVDADTGRVESIAVQAGQVYTMGLPKVGHVLPPGLDYSRDVVTLDIGFPYDLLENAESEALLLCAREVDSWLPKRPQSAHKGTQGHLLVIAGSRGMTGAALLCAKAAITTGAGLVTTVCPQSLHPVYAGGVWEMLTLPVQETTDGSMGEEAFESIFTGNNHYTAVVIGPGLSRNASTMNLVKRVLQTVEIPVLVDGDGLFAVTVEALHQRNSPWVVTPHPGEMARLCQTTPAEVQSNRWEKARFLANSPSGTVVLKGAKSIIAVQNKALLINPTGSPAMASAGMGDVLAGMIGAFMAQGLSPRRSAACGTYLHGQAADLLVDETGTESVSATQVLGHIPYALARVRTITYTK